MTVAAAKRAPRQEMFAQIEIVARRKNAPQNFPRKTQVRTSAVSKFSDAEHWNELATKYLPRYDLPGWDVLCDPMAMARWLDRLELSERDHIQATATTLEIFCTLNAAWPLRAWIGLLLEMQDERARS